MDSRELQQTILRLVRQKLPASQQLVDALADVLDISPDSVYRRIRGEKMLTLDELYLICTRYHISLDQLLNPDPNAFVFTGNFISTDSFRFDDYLNNIVQQVKYMNGFREKEMIYMCKDIPIFHHFHFRELAAFKYYFWMKNILHFPEFARKKFRMEDYPDEFFELGRKALEYYNQLDSIEVWNIESINSTIRQVEFYHDSNIFESDETIYMIYEALGKLIDHLEQQATAGYKFTINDPEQKALGKYQLYFNEIIILENSILVNLDGNRAAFLIHNVLNVMITRDVNFCENMNRYIRNLIRKSTLISSVSERERIRFFRHLRHRIEGRKQHLKR